MRGGITKLYHGSPLGLDSVFLIRSSLVDLQTFRFACEMSSPVVTYPLFLSPVLESETSKGCLLARTCATRRGFTLIELLVVISIMRATLMSLVLPPCKAPANGLVAWNVPTT